MISVKDLIEWAESNSVGRSPSHPKGWISSKKLIQLAGEVAYVEPREYKWSLQNNLEQEGISNEQK